MKWGLRDRRASRKLGILERRSVAHPYPYALWLLPENGGGGFVVRDIDSGSPLFLPLHPLPWSDPGSLLSPKDRHHRLDLSEVGSEFLGLIEDSIHCKMQILGRLVLTAELYGLFFR